MKCKICSSETITYNIGESPLAGYICENLNESKSQPKFPLELLYCTECGLLYYNEIKDAEIYLDKLYSNHLSTFHINKEFEDYLNNFVQKIFDRKDNIQNVLEIGCNDGYILSLFKQKKEDIKLYGVEPSTKFNKIWTDRSINTYNNYFDESAVNFLNEVKFDIIYFRHVFEHIFNPVIFFENVSKISNSDTLIVIEVPYLKSIIKNNRIDNLGYSHSNFFSVTSINNIINNFGFDVVDYEEVNTDGGSIVVYIKKVENSIQKNSKDKLSINEIDLFINSINNLKKKYQEEIVKYSIKELIGYGAGAKGQHLIHILGLNNYINNVVDDTPEYNNKYIPGTSIKILNPSKINYNGIKAVINLVPTHHKVIKSKIPKNIDFIDFIN